MKKNMSALDQLVRLTLAVVFGVLYYNDYVGGTLGVILVILSTAFLLTSFTGNCPVYTVLGINTCRTKK